MRCLVGLLLQKNLLHVVGLLLLVEVVDATATATAEYPSEIHLRVGVLNGPPFAAATDDPVTGEKTYTGGFMIELMQSLTVFAAHDNVKLGFHFSPVDPDYNKTLELVSNTCLDTRSEDECDQYDLLAGDFYATPERSLKTDLSPPWLTASIGLMRKAPGDDGFLKEARVNTMEQAVERHVPVCLVTGTYVSQLVRERYPDGKYIDCVQDGRQGLNCLAAVSNRTCEFVAANELILRFIEFNQPGYEVLRETFNTQVS